MSARDPVSIGFLPLTDAAVLVAAREAGFAAAEGIALSLLKETSWANIRDRMAVGHFDAAHMLAPMPIAANLGLTPLSLPLVAPMALGLGGNAVTVSRTLHAAMAGKGARDVMDAGAAGRALRAVIEEGRSTGAPRLQFAVVHPHSGHNLELRYWLAACGIDPQADLDIVIVPPPLMADALAAGRIDGYCVGEPWNSMAVVSGHGCLATVKAAIWRSSPEKVLAVRADWADERAELLGRLLRALYHAAEWCGRPENRETLAGLLARPSYLDRDAGLILAALTGRLPTGDGTVEIPDFFLPFARAATFPWQSHALWFYAQMVRWGEVTHSAVNAEIARTSYRPDIHRAALRPLGIPLPGANSKVEGALTVETPVGATSGKLVLGPDGFFDGGIFDPDALDAYIAGQAPSVRR